MRRLPLTPRASSNYSLRRTAAAANCPRPAAAPSSRPAAAAAATIVACCRRGAAAAHSTRAGCRPRGLLHTLHPHPQRRGWCWGTETTMGQRARDAWGESVWALRREQRCGSKAAGALRAGTHKIVITPRNLKQQAVSRFQHLLLKYSLVVLRRGGRERRVRIGAWREARGCAAGQGAQDWPAGDNEHPQQAGGE